MPEVWNLDVEVLEIKELSTAQPKIRCPRTQTEALRIVRLDSVDLVDLTDVRDHPKTVEKVRTMDFSICKPSGRRG